VRQVAQHVPAGLEAFLERQRAFLVDEPPLEAVGKG
jgi:hypothetical protein